MHVVGDGGGEGVRGKVVGRSERGRGDGVLARGEGFEHRDVGGEGQDGGGVVVEEVEQGVVPVEDLGLEG